VYNKTVYPEGGSLMKMTVKQDVLDVLVVYSAAQAVSASVEDTHSKHPFLLSSQQSNYNLSYAYLLQACQKNGLKVGLTTSADVIGPGKCKNYWTFLAGNWNKVGNNAQSVHIFDKVSPMSATRTAEIKLLLSDSTVIPFNDVELFALFCDKLLTYKKLAEFTIPTANLGSKKIIDINKSIQRLTALVKKHPFAQDFSAQIVLKDRFGAGGNHVYKITRNYASQIRKILVNNPEVKFVIQPFLAFDKGFIFQGQQTSTDLRLIFHHNKLLQSYIRMAKPDDFRCNEHQGGELVYVNSAEIPAKVHELAKKMFTKINKPDSLFALDFIISNSGRPYFIEGNIGPGIDWDITKKFNEKMSKQLIRSIVGELTNRVHKPSALQLSA
jgi:glutathione synthase/RimK-type ligase-like ATP-grasp enzyme